MIIHSSSAIVGVGVGVGVAVGVGVGVGSSSLMATLLGIDAICIAPTLPSVCDIL